MKRLGLLIIALAFALSINAQEKEFKFNAFNKVVIDFPTKVQIVYGPEYSIRVVDSTKSKTVVLILDKLDKKQDKSSLDLERFTISDHDSTLYISSSKDIKGRLPKINIFITMPELKLLTIETAASVIITGAFDQDFMALELEGASSVRLMGKPRIRHLSIDDEGASYVRISLDSTIEYADFDIEGASLISALETPIKKINAKVEGASLVKIWPTEVMNIDVEGMSYVMYKGNPKQTHISSDGISIVKRAD